MSWLLIVGLFLQNGHSGRTSRRILECVVAVGVFVAVSLLSCLCVSLLHLETEHKQFFVSFHILFTTNSQILLIEIAVHKHNLNCRQMEISWRCSNWNRRQNFITRNFKKKTLQSSKSWRGRRRDWASATFHWRTSSFKYWIWVSREGELF